MAFIPSGRPRVEVRENDISQIVRARAGTIGALVGYAEKGPSFQRVLITNTKEFVDTFGEPDSRSQTYFHYTALTFLESGNRLYCTRVHNEAKYAAGWLMGTGTGNTTLTARTPTEGFNGKINFDITSADDININTDADGTLSADGNGLSENDLPQILFLAKTEGVDLNGLVIYFEEKGFVNTDGSINLSTDRPTPDETNFRQFIYRLTVKRNRSDDDVNALETFDVTIGNARDGFGRQLKIDERINSESQYIQIRVYADGALRNLANINGQSDTAVVKLGGGSLGNTLVDAQYLTGWGLYSPDTVTGASSQVETDIESLNISLFIAGGVSETVQNAIIPIAKKNEGLAILDIPFASRDDPKDQTIAPKDSYGALFAPWITVYDSYNGTSNHPIPPSGLVAGRIVYTERVRALWYAAAGPVRGTVASEQFPVTGVSNVYSEGTRDELYNQPNNINVIRRTEDGVITIDGNKTLQTFDSALDRINVRRLVSFVKKTVKRSLRSVLFELNTESTRFRVRSTIEDFLSNIQADQGLYSFRVVCDESNNTPADIDQNLLNVDVYLQPTRTVEYISLQAIVTRTGVSLQEIISNNIA